MTSRRALLYAAILLPMACLSVAAPEAARAQGSPMPPAFADRAASGDALANAWFGLLAIEPVDPAVHNTPEEIVAEQALVKPYLDPAFQAQRTSGRRYNADDFVPVDIKTFTVSGAVTTEPAAGVKVVRYAVTTPNATVPDRGWLFSNDARPRLQVFRWDSGRGHWMVVSLANFNTPTAAICDAVPVSWAAMPSQTSAEDAALGRSLVTEWQAVAKGLPRKTMISRQLNIQLADGQGWPNPASTPIAWSPAQTYESEDILTTRSGDLLVVSYVAVISGLKMEGLTYGSARHPRLLTFIRNAQGEWELIALANFVTPVPIPAGVSCVTKVP